MDIDIEMNRQESPTRMMPQPSYSIVRQESSLQLSTLVSTESVTADTAGSSSQVPSAAVDIQRPQQSFFCGIDETPLYPTCCYAFGMFQFCLHAFIRTYGKTVRILVWPGEDYSRQVFS